MPEYKPPASLESEQTVLGIILLYPEKLPEIIEIIRPEDFYRAGHGIIYQAMLNLLEADTPIELVTLISHLKEKGQIEKVGGQGFLTDLAAQIGTSANFKYHVQVVHDKSTLRRLLNSSQSIASGCLAPIENVQEYLNWAKNQIGEIIDGAKFKPGKNITAKVQELISTSTGLIMTSDVHYELNLTSRDLKKQANEAIRRLAESGKLTPCGDKRGCYRIVEESEEIDWKSADIENTYPIKWPFEIEKYVTIYPGNIIVLAGEKNAGKTALLHNLIKLNQDSHKIIYFNSESGKEEMKLRLSKHEDISLEAWHFKTFARSTNFPEAVHPDRLNIIDYYELTDNFYQIGGEIRKIHDRLRKGICVIALQKKVGAETGRGGDFSREKSRLYMTMGGGKLKILDAKIWAGDENPNGMVFTYKLIGGWKFLEWE